MIPDWLPEEAWAEFIKMRKQIKRPMTPYAESLMKKRLRAMVDAGQDAQAVLDQSILNCWQNIYELKIEAPAAVAKPGLRVVPTPNWWCSDGGIIAKGRELSMDPRPGESFGQFKDRIFSRLENVNTRRSAQ